MIDQFNIIIQNIIIIITITITIIITIIAITIKFTSGSRPDCISNTNTKLY